jgi:hypothetical protein
VREKLYEAVDEFSRFIKELPGVALAEKAWGPKEVLIHLVFWLESFVTQTEAILAKEPFEPLRGRFDDLNAQAIEANRDVPVDELLRRYQVACERLCDLAQTHDPESITLEIKKGSVLRTLTRLMAEEASHIRNHHQRLRKELEDS